MLDLSLQGNLYRFKWIDGAEYTLKPPTQKQYMMANMFKESSDMAVLEGLYDLILAIVNRNVNQKQFIKDEVDELSLDLCIALMEDYFNFYNKQMEERVVFQQAH